MIYPNPLKTRMRCGPQALQHPWPQRQTEAFKIALHRDKGKENGNYRNYRDYIGYILGPYSDNGKENGSYRSMLGLYRDNGKNGSYCSILELYKDVMEKKMEATIQGLGFREKGWP